MVSFPDAFSEWRIKISICLTYMAMYVLLYTIILIAGILFVSLISGDWVFKYWGNWDMNHGPWRYTFFFYDLPRYKLSLSLSYTFLLLIFSTLMSFLSILLRFSRCSVIVFAICFSALWLSTYYLYWLID